MATTAQINANRRNALKSTGPRSAAGRAVSRFNALKTGIYGREQVIRGESAATLDALAAEYHERWRPATPEARALVDSLVSSEWLLRRLRKAEAQYWEYKMDSVLTLDRDNPLGQTVANGAETFARLQRRIDSAERNFHRALKELRRQADAPAPCVPTPGPARPIEITLDPTPSPRPIGFVPPLSVGQTPRSAPDPLVRQRPEGPSYGWVEPSISACHSIPASTIRANHPPEVRIGG